jgi:hypothetical protein
MKRQRLNNDEAVPVEGKEHRLKSYGDSLQSVYSPGA